MKSVSIAFVALGLLLATAAPSLAHGPWVAAHHRHYGYAGPYIYGTYSPVVVAAAPVVTPAPVYDYTTYPLVAAPVYVPVAPRPYYYYGAPAVTFGYRGRGVSIGVGF